MGHLVYTIYACKKRASKVFCMVIDVKHLEFN